MGHRIALLTAARDATFEVRLTKRTVRIAVPLMSKVARIPQVSYIRVTNDAAWGNPQI